MICIVNLLSQLIDITYQIYIITIISVNSERIWYQPVIILFLHSQCIIIIYHSYERNIDRHGFRFFYKKNIENMQTASQSGYETFQCKIEWVPDQRFHLKLVITSNERNRSHVTCIHTGIPHQSSKYKSCGNAATWRHTHNVVNYYY